MMTPVPGSDERGYAKRISDRLGTALHTEWLGFEHMQFDFAPPSDSVAPRVGPLQHAVEQVMQGAADRLGANAHISGAGGDTVFCYLRTAAPATDAIRAAGLWRGLTTIWDLSQLHQCTVWKAGRLALRKLLRPPTAPYVKEHAFLSSKVRTDVEAHPWYAVPTEVLPGDRERIFELAGSQVFRESTVRGHARPVRMPLLSQPVMESCLRVPTWMWVTGGHNRAVARSAFAERLPPELLHRRSKGSLMNFLGATYGRTKHSVGDFLLSGELTSRGLLDADSLRQFIGRELLPREETFTRLYDLCMIENWVRHNA
jgi:asparagine synthase (glutamine-hydrolysing)